MASRETSKPPVSTRETMSKTKKAQVGQIPQVQSMKVEMKCNLFWKMMKTLKKEVIVRLQNHIVQLKAIRIL
jgi:hypothetical protein